QRNERTGRGAHEHAKGERDFATQGLDGFRNSFLAHGLLIDLLYESAIGFVIPEAAGDLGFGLGPRHADSHELVEAFLQVKAEFLAERGVYPVTGKRKPEDAPQSRPASIGA